MAETPQNEGTGVGKPYRRSWKNLLINKRYQLRFTLFMVGLSAVLMMLLGIWVKRVADNTTEVGLARVRGEPCPPVPEPAASSNGAAPVMSPAPAAQPPASSAASVAAPDAASASAPAATPVEPAPADPAVPSEIVEPAAAAGSGSGEASAAADDADPDGLDADRPRNVTVGETSMTLTPTPAAAPAVDLAAARATFRECEKKQAGLIDDLQQRRRNIGWVLLGSGLLLCFGLALYGIKTTHRVAGPLHKVGTYFTKMKAGRYDTVYPLRKGDELMEFYEHFKQAHAGVVTAEKNDIAKMRAVVAASGSGPHDPQLAKALKDLQVALERKEKAVE